MSLILPNDILTSTMINTDAKKITELLERSVVEALPQAKSIQKKLESGETLRIKLGIDPTSPNLHIGRSIPLLKLKDFQDLGHQIVLIIGDYTGVIGDTSDKDSERPMLTEETIQQNLKTYEEQAGKILDMSKVELRRNSEWLSKLGYGEIGRHAGVFSVADFIARDNIKRRLDEGKRVSLREVLYPLMQGYDSVAVDADIELGGTDQKFNLLAGRDLQKEFGQEPQDILMMEIINGLDGRKMSSSWGNTINLMDPANEMYGKVMSMRDENIITYFTNCTRVPMKEVKGYEQDIASGVNPRDVKMKLALELVQMYHDEKSAEAAQEAFVTQFQKQEIPEDLPEVLINEDLGIIEVLKNASLVSSNNEARRKIEEGAVTINGDKITNISFKVKGGVKPGDTVILKLGRKIIKLKFK